MHEPTSSPIVLAHPSLFQREEIEAYECLLGDPRVTETDASEFFFQFPKFLWLGQAADLRREVVLQRSESAYRVDFFRRRYGRRYWDIVELKSPSTAFVAGCGSLHSHLSASVTGAVNQAQDYRDAIIADELLRADLEKKGILVHRPQILVVVGRSDGLLVPSDRLEVLYDRVRQQSVEAMSYSDILAFAKEHYASNQAIVLPALHYQLSPANACQAILAEIHKDYPILRSKIFVVEVRTVRAIAQIGMDEHDYRRMVHSMDSTDIVVDAVRRGEPRVVPGWDPRFDPSIHFKYKPAAMVVAVPIVTREKVVGVLQVDFLNEIARVPEVLDRLSERLATVGASLLDVNDSEK